MAASFISEPLAPDASFDPLAMARVVKVAHGNVPADGD